MDPSRLRKRQIAKRLGVSEQVLDQYLQLKRAEVLVPRQDGDSGSGQGEPATPSTEAGSAEREPHAAPAAASRASSRWSRRLQPVSAGRGRD